MLSAMARSRVACVFALCLLGNAFSVPVKVPRPRRDFTDNELDSQEISRDGVGNDASSIDEQSNVPINPAFTLPPVTNNYEDKKKEIQAQDSFEDDDDFPEPLQTSSTQGGGSNILSLLNLVNGLFPASGGANFQKVLRNMIREYLKRYPQPLIKIRAQNKRLRRQLFLDNEIDIDYPFDLKPPPFQRQESDENGSDSDSDTSETKEDTREDTREDTKEDNKEDTREDSKEESKEESEEDNDDDENNGGEESIEENDDDGNDNDDDGSNNASQQNSDSKPASDGNGDDNDSDNDSDYDDEPPGGGDGQGGGILGILAGLSGGEDGQSDLGSLLATISGIVVNLSGDGIDLNSIIASGIGLFVGLLSEGEENPGTIIAEYLLTSLETITGGGAKNNGAFFGKFLSKLISGTSAGEAPEGASDENSAEPPKDSASFLLSLLMGLSGDLSKSSSKGSSQPW